MAEAIVIREYGAADVMKVEQVDIPAPGRGELHIKQTMVGVNYHDVYVRSGSVQDTSVARHARL